MEPSPITIEKHEPERRRKAVTTLNCGCTCCCCCCLHTLGSIVGAAVAPAISLGSPMPIAYYYDEDLGEQVPDLRKPGLSSVTVFWWLLCLQIMVGFGFGVLSGSANAGTLLITAVIIALVLPGLQLISALVTLIIFAIWPRYDKARQLKQLAKISGGIVIGSVLGIAAMAAIGFVMGAFR